MALATRWRRPGRLERLGGAANREVVRLGAAAREDDLGRIGADQGGDRRPRLVERRLGLLAEVVHARRRCRTSRGARARPTSATAGAGGVVAL